MRKLTDIVQSIKNNFVANFIMQSTYDLDAAKTFDEQFRTVSIEAQYVDLTASAIYDHEQIVDDRAADIEAQIAAAYPFSRAWFYDTALSFQLGDTLQFNPDTYKFSYPVISDTKRIIKFVAIRQLIIEGVTILRIYVTKDGKQALTPDEMNAFSAYMFQVGYAGAHFEYVSENPDNLVVNYRVYYNPQILNMGGERLSGGGKPVEEAIANYLNSIRYGGAFNRTKCDDAVQKADGVSDIILGDVYMNEELANDQTFESPSGFFNAQSINVVYTPYYED